RRRSLLRFFFQAEDGIRDGHVTGVQTCALPISVWRNRYFNRHIVGGPSRNRILGSFPDTISTTKLELFFSGSSELVRKFFEEILAANEPKTNNSRTNVAGHNECHFTVAYLVAITPPFVCNFFHFDVCASMRSDHQAKGKQ